MTFQVVGIQREVTRSKVRIAPHHLLGLPAREFLQSKERRSVLHVPRGPGMPQIVPPEALDAGAGERLVPSLRAELLHRPASIREYEQGCRSNASVRLTVALVQHSACRAFGYCVDQRPVDIPQLSIRRIVVEPAKLALVLLVGRLVDLLTKLPLGSVLPYPLGRSPSLCTRQASLLS